MERTTTLLGFKLSWASIILVIAGIVYALSLNYYYFGLFTDDARHFTAAQSLLQFRYVSLTHPQDPPLINQLPGYPLLIMPAALFNSPRLAQWMNIGFLLGSLLLLMQLFGRTAAGKAAVILTALHPLVVIQTDTVMTEASYLFFTTWALLYLVRLLDHPKELGRTAILRLAVLCAWCGWIHPHGTTLFLAASLLLLENKFSRKWAYLFIAMGGFLLAIPYVYNLWVAGIPTTYFGEVNDLRSGSLSQLAVLAKIIGSNLCRFPFLLTNESMLSWMEPLYGTNSVLARIVGLGVLTLVILGLQRNMRASNLGRAIAFYVILYIGLHLFWVNQFLRYTIPMLPFLFWFFFSAPFFAAKPKWATSAAALLIVFFSLLDANIIVNAHISRPNENVPPVKTIEWIKKNVPPDAVVASELDETLHYYTDRKYIQPVSILDPDDWFHQLVVQHVQYYAEDQGSFMPAVPTKQHGFDAALHLARGQLKDPARFALVYQPIGENFGIYRVVVQRDAYEQGYRLFQEGKEDIKAGHLETAYQHLLQAEKTHAPLVRLPFYLGTTAMLLGKNAEARKYLQKTLLQEFDFTQAQLNLARLDSMKRT